MLVWNSKQGVISYSFQTGRWQWLDGSPLTFNEQWFVPGSLPFSDYASQVSSGHKYQYGTSMSEGFSQHVEQFKHMHPYVNNKQTQCSALMMPVSFQNHDWMAINCDTPARATMCVPRNTPSPPSGWSQSQTAL